MNRDSNPPKWNDYVSTRWRYEGIIEYAGHQLRRRSGGSTFLDALRAIISPPGINIFLLGAALLLLLCPGAILYWVLALACKATIKRPDTSIENT